MSSRDAGFPASRERHLSEKPGFDAGLFVCPPRSPPPTTRHSSSAVGAICAVWRYSRTSTGTCQRSSPAGTSCALAPARPRRARRAATPRRGRASAIVFSRNALCAVNTIDTACADGRALRRRRCRAGASAGCDRGPKRRCSRAPAAVRCGRSRAAAVRSASGAVTGHERVVAERDHRVAALVQPVRDVGMPVAKHELHAALRHQVFAAARVVGERLDRARAAVASRARRASAGRT